jgi:hypothetical protein
MWKLLIGLTAESECASRTWDFTPIRGSSNVGFRCVRDGDLTGQ